MISVSNRLLFSKKLLALEFFKNNFNKDLFKYEFACNYHGVSLKIYSQTEKLKQSLLHFIPPSWLKTNDRIFQIYLLNPEYFNYSPMIWSDETSQDCYSIENNSKSIQRDFASWYISSNQILLICEDVVSDGFHNFLRWFISERLIANHKYVVHASCVLDKNSQGHIFLGHSGAGKTTITQLSAPRLVLGDDMNIISLENNNLMVEAGAIGGLFNSMIGYDKKMQVKALYWLKQSTENKLEKLPESIAHQKLLASFANLHWPTLPDETARKLIDFSHRAVNGIECYELQFKKDISIWDILDS